MGRIRLLSRGTQAIDTETRLQAGPPRLIACTATSWLQLLGSPLVLGVGLGLGLVRRVVDGPLAELRLVRPHIPH